ncbi:hypothetical protein GCM10023114_51010 [Mycolicibacterium sediminis]|uniref:Uncharacterized protein n=1 Tax=Mycolicibacterium sediminis TaxID=1286180 RepID=A0A7I7QMR9_9MYCO|nr:hypothetical protein MSEDJ_12420 [Mycolicibacterium sediminis]
MEDAIQIHAEEGLPIDRFGCSESAPSEEAIGACVSGIIDQNIHGAGRGESISDGLVVRNVERQRARRSSRRQYLLDDTVCTLAPQIVDQNLGTRRGKSEGKAAPDALPGAGDRDATSGNVQLQCHRIFPLAFEAG